jgi:hypothetical protein
MPNGHDRNWVRFCMAVRGFRARHGTWPTRMRLDPGYIEEFRSSLLSPADFENLKTKVELISEPDARFVAEDDQGRTYNYATESLHWERNEIDAEGWLGIETLPEVW